MDNQVTVVMDKGYPYETIAGMLATTFKIANITMIPQFNQGEAYNIVKDGKKYYVDAVSLFRCAGKLAGLYPDDPYLALLVDEVLNVFASNEPENVKLERIRDVYTEKKGMKNSTLFDSQITTADLILYAFDVNILKSDFEILYKARQDAVKHKLIKPHL